MYCVGLIGDERNMHLRISQSISILPKNEREIIDRLIFEQCLMLISWHDTESKFLITQIKQLPFFQWLPVIILFQDELSSADKIDYLNMGVDEFSLASEWDELQLRIETLCKRSANFINQAYRDPLTGVFNRRYFLMILEYLCKHTDRPLSLAFLDLDHFKSINDTYGHDIGDLALQGMANLIQRYLAPRDVFGRYGGEEYILLMETGLEEAKNRLNEVLSACRQTPVVDKDDIQIHVTFSSGVCEYEKSMSIDQFLKAADDAAYKAKRRGRNRVVAAKRKTDLSRLLVIGNLDQYPCVHDLNIETFSAHDIEEALSHLSRVEIDIILIDFLAIGSLGWTLIDSIRSLGYNPTFVLLAGKGLRQQFIMRAEQMCIQHYLCRPFDQRTLMNTLSEILDKHE